MNFNRYKNKNDRSTHPNFNYSEVFHFCRNHKNKGNDLKNSLKEYPPRVSPITKLLEKIQVPYKGHSFTTKRILEDYTINNNIFHRVYLPISKLGTMLFYENSYLDLSILNQCHKMSYSSYGICKAGMKQFVPNVLPPITKFKS